MTPSLRKLTCALLLAAALLVVPAGASAAPTAAPAEFFGSNIQALIRQGFVKPASWATYLRAGGQAGLTIARFDAPWDWAEPRAPAVNGAHRYDWTRLDQIATLTASQGVRWLPVVDLPPAWAKTADNDLPDNRQADFAAFAGAFAARYATGGTFWAQHPELPQLPIQQVEVWTEANSSHFWAADPDASRYLQLYIQVRTAMKAIDPNLHVLTSLGWQDFQGFANRLYDAGLKGQSDGVAFHPYAPTARGVVILTRRLRETLVARGEPDLPIYMTEVGWPKAASGPGALRSYDGPVSDAARAATTSLAADALAGSDCNVKDFIVYSLVEEQKNPANLEDWLGMFNADGTPTLTLGALSGSAARWSTAGIRARAASNTTLQPLCHGPESDQAVSSYTMPPNEQLPITMKVPMPATQPCTTVQTSYYGNPLEDVSVFVRTYRGRQAGVVTRATGDAALCLAAASRKQPFLVWARSGALAASPVRLCRGARCYPVSCRRARLNVTGKRRSATSMTLTLSVTCGKRLLFGEPIKVNGIDRAGRPHKLAELVTATRTQTVRVSWSAKHRLRAIRVRFAGDRTFKLPARVKGIALKRR